MYAIAVCDDDMERVEWNKKLETFYMIHALMHVYSIVFPSASLRSGCITE